MANSSISGLVGGVTVTDGDLLPDVQQVGIGPVRVTALQFKSYIGDGLSLTNPTIVGGVINFGGWTATFPLSPGLTGQVLTTDGLGNLSWDGGGGTVSSVDATGATTGLTFIGGPITTTGTLSLGGILNIAHGGTNATTRAQALLNLLPPINTNTASYALYNDGVSKFYWASSGGGGAPVNTLTVGITNINNGISGSIPFNDAGVYGENNNKLFWDNTNFRLGVGTNTPTNVLTVFGSDALINDLTIGVGSGNVTSNTALGYTALAANTSGAQNTAVGNTVLASNTSGVCNTATGYSAASANDTGNFNTAFGSNALLSNVSGDFNTAIGSDALRVTTAGSNTAVGCSALAANVSGSSNIAVGVNALTTNVAGSNNIAVGDSALGVNTADFNIAVGTSALSANISGSRNVAVGNNTLSANIGANYNTAIGDSALLINNAGDGNTAVGYFSLSGNVNGINNVAVGINALDANTASYNVAIGANALGANTVGTPNVAVGNNALLTNTSGSGHVAVGDSALKNNQTGQQNTAIGSAALETNTIGQSNVAVGANALQSVNTGNGNTGIGFSALTLATGSNNLAIGNNSGSSITTGSGNVIVGSYVGSGSPITSSGSNFIVLSDGNGNVRLYIDGNNNTVTQTAALATSATNGFLYIPTAAGTPTGAPVSKVGTAPILVDTTNNLFYYYSSGAWRTPSGGLTTLTVNTTTITGGTSGRLVFDNAGKFGEVANITTDGAATLTVGNPLGGAAGLVSIVSSTAKTVSLATANTTVSNYTLTLPPTTGTANQVLTTNGTGATSWQSIQTTFFFQLTGMVFYLDVVDMITSFGVTDAVGNIYIVENLQGFDVIQNCVALNNTASFPLISTANTVTFKNGKTTTISTTSTAGINSYVIMSVSA